MFVSQHSQPPAQSLVELIQLCGGTVSKTVRQAGICIGRYSGRRPEGCQIVSEQWVLGEMPPSFQCCWIAHGSCHVINHLSPSLFMWFQIVSHIWSRCHTMTTTWSEGCRILLHLVLKFCNELVTCPECHPAFDLWQLGCAPADTHDPELRDKRVLKMDEGMLSTNSNPTLTLTLS